jgi:hypothetical protein
MTRITSPVLPLSVFRSLSRLAGAGLAALLLAGPPRWPALGQELDDGLDTMGATEGKDQVSAELMKGLGAGPRFRFVVFDQPDQGLTNRVFWRLFNNYCAAQVGPVRLRLDKKEVIAPRTVQDPTSGELRIEYPTEAHQFISSGSHVLQPGDIPIVMTDKPASDHPAIRIVGDEIRILCVPVRFDARDADDRPVPMKIVVSCGGLSLVRAEENFNPLILWLPVGVTYQSSFGAFQITPAGKVQADPADLEEGVRVTEAGLRLVRPSRGPSPPAREAASDPAKLFLVAHRGRTVFTPQETPVFAVIVPRGNGLREARVLCRLEGKPDSGPFELGTLTLPTVARGAFDSRLFVLDVGAVPPGDHQIWVEAGSARSAPVPLTVVPWFHRSPFFVHSRSACIELWPTSDTGFKILRDAGLEMGADTPLDAAMLRLGDRRAGGTLPEETTLVRSPNDVLLERMLRYQLRSLDLVVTRAAAFYNEGLSYHHSYKPSVDRMIRRLQIFTQQTADYPSFWGVNYSWYPQLFGYSEAGVPTDAHVYDRNVALAANLAGAGHTNATKEELEWLEKNKWAADPAVREKALAIQRRAIAYWKAQMDFGFGRHNRLYNEAVRQVRPQTACTLFENAGHDAMKPTLSLFNDMEACCYESYTDFGEWAMSASFTTDWARGNAPGRPVWLTTDWGTSSEGMMKSLFHAFGRGLAGGGVPMSSGTAAAELARRGKGMRFLSQYGALARHAIPDRRFAILATDSMQRFNHRAPFVYHALYYHLTRLGCAPVILSEPTVTASGIPSETRVLCVVRQEYPLEPAVERAIETFRQKGGKVLVTGDSVLKPKGAVVVDRPVQTIWSMGGFAWSTHGAMWTEFETNWREPLSTALAELAVPAAATADPDRGLVVCMDAGPVRYAVVIADKRGAHFAEFEPTEALPVSLEGTGWTVRDLVKQKTLEATTKGGRTEVAVDLVTEPTTVLALYKSAPATVQVRVPAACALGSNLVFLAAVLDAGGASLGPLPVTCTLVDPAGRVRCALHRAAGDEVRLSLPALDVPGGWKLTVQELLTGLTASVSLDVAPGRTPLSAVRAVGDVHVVNESHLRAFAQRDGEIAVIVEPGRPGVRPIARKLVESLTAAGVKARLWEVSPEEFDTIPMRYYPRREDAENLTLIEAGRLIGYRRNMEPYIDTRARANVPAKGGYEEIEPFYMIGEDAILFSGGPLAESLRAVTPWMDTPNVPGQGQGRLLTVFSPFMADRHVVAVIANDNEGMARAAEELARWLAGARGAASVAEATAAVETPPAAVASAIVAPASVAQPFVNYTPLRRVERLLAARSGKAVALLKGRQDNVVFVDENGIPGASLFLPWTAAHSAGVDADGRLWSYRFGAPDAKKGAFRVTAQRVSPPGVIERELVVYEGSAAEMGPHGAEAAFPVAPDGVTAAWGRLGGIQLGNLADNTWRWYDDMPHVRRTFEVWTPRFPGAMAFSPDSRCLFFTMDTRPTGYENMHQRLDRPEGSESVLIDAKTGQRIWGLRGEPAQYACFNGFSAVAADGAITAFADVDARLYLVDRSGKIIRSEPGNPVRQRRGFQDRPADGVGVWIAPDGRLAAFGFRNRLMLADASGFRRVPVADLCSGAVSADGPLAVVGFDSGEVKAFDGRGNAVWSFPAGGVSPKIAAIRTNETLVATSGGELVLLDGTGREVRRCSLVAKADKERHDPVRGAELRPEPPPFHYTDPGTLQTAVARLGAKAVAEWKPSGPAVAAHGLTFYPVDGSIDLAAEVKGDSFLHLVYRRPADNRKLTVVVARGKGREEFILDLPTPGYRIVDIPMRGPGSHVRVESEGPAEIAEASLWSLAWPGPNLAWVRPADAAAGTLDLGGTKEAESGIPDLEEDGGGVLGGMKECRIWCPNPDIDKVQGQWFNSPLNALIVVNGRWWDTGGQAWNATAKFVGEWFTESFAKAVKLSLVATYDRSRRQSEVTSNLAVFSGAFGGERAQGAAVLGAAIRNDQFWRLFSFPSAGVTILGAYVSRGDATPEGLSEMEAYR